MPKLTTKDAESMFKLSSVEELTVLVYTRPHMRNNNLEYELHMGKHILEGIFDKMVEMPEVVNATFSFPENWTNIIEQRALYRRLGKYCPNLRYVTIKTQSVYIIQCTSAKYIGVMQYNEPTPQEGDEGRLWLPMNGSFLDSNKLTILNKGQ